MVQTKGRPRLSLARRLVVGVAVLSFILLAIMAWVLSAVNRTQTLQLLDDELGAELASLTRSIDANENGTITLFEAFLPSDRRYLTPLSGLYWAVAVLDEAGNIAEEERSRSLWDGELPGYEGDVSLIALTPGRTIYTNGIGPNSERVRVAASSILLPELETPVIVLVAADRTRIDTISQQFFYTLAAAMGALAVMLIIAMIIQVRVALRPLLRIERDVADIRAGEKERLSDDYPEEVLPLTVELNKLLDHNRDVVDRARTHVGNLAHALKTPIAVLMNEAGGEDEFSKVVRRQTNAMSDNVQHYLKRAQAAARAEVLGARTPIDLAIADLARVLPRVFRDKDLTINVEGTRGLQFRGERQDLDDLIGNLMENAAKWARAVVDVTITPDGADRIVIHVDDDGPGLTPEERVEAVKRGMRLDETAPGTGLGLSIVKELAELYSGSFDLSDSPAGGLRATLKLPAVNLPALS